MVEVRSVEEQDGGGGHDRKVEREGSIRIGGGGKEGRRAGWGGGVDRIAR